MMPEKRRDRAPKGNPATSTSTATVTAEFTARAAVVSFDARAAARLTETGLEPVDVALTFTGIAAEARAVARG